MSQNPGLSVLTKYSSLAERIKKTLPPIQSRDVPVFVKADSLRNLSRVEALTYKWTEMNRIIGNPIHPGTGKVCPVTPSQIAYHNVWNLTHRVAYNKSRKRGATEASLRTVLENCFDRYVGHKVIMISGNRQSQADDYLTRFDDLLWGPNDKGWTDAEGKLWKYGDLVSQKRHDTMKMTCGVELQTIPANEYAVRGLENVKCVLFIECAHIDRTEDKKVYTATHPLASNDDTMDFILETTPNGKRGFFYNNFINPTTEYFKLEYDYTSAIEEGLMTQQFIDKEKNNPEIDWEQEYCCKFTTSNSAVFKEGSVVYLPEQVTDYSDILNSK